eukprot:Rmarinus@m.19094
MTEDKKAGANPQGTADATEKKEKRERRPRPKKAENQDANKDKDTPKDNVPEGDKSGEGDSGRRRRQPRRRSRRNSNKNDEKNAEEKTGEKDEARPAERRRRNRRSRKGEGNDGEGEKASDDKAAKPAQRRRRRSDRKENDGEDAKDDSNKVRVSAETASSRLAGMMASLCRNSEVESKRFVAVGAFANNQAIKSMVIARRYLSQDGEGEGEKKTGESSDVAFNVHFVRLPGFEEGGRGIEYRLQKAENIEKSDKVTDFKVSKKTPVTKLAGAIARGVRNNEDITVQGVGPFSVNQAVKAIALAESYLKRGNTQLLCQPEFVEITFDDRKSTAVRLYVTAISTGEN